MTAKSARILWIVAVVAMGMTAAMNLFGGIGTVCAAFLTKNFPPMLVLLDHQWLYQRMMLITIAIGIAGASATFRAVSGWPQCLSQRFAGADRRRGVGRAARACLAGAARQDGSGQHQVLHQPVHAGPVPDLGLLSIRSGISFSKPRRNEAAAAGGMAALIVGITMLTMPWVGSSHTYEGTDWTGVLQPGLSIVGLAFTAGGLGVFLKALAAVIRQPEPAILAHEVRP